MAAAARPGAASSNSLLLSRSPPHAAAAALALAPSPGSSMRRRLILGVGTPAIAALAAAAPPSVLQDGAVTVLITAGAYSLVRVFDELTERRLIDKSLSRKVVHVLSGVLFMSSWPLFSNSTEARYFAAVVPLLNSIRLLIYGLRLYTDEALVKSVTREGKPEELLRGPLYYVLMLLFSVLVFWRESPVGIISLSMMSGGDGFADIIGRRYGSVKLPFNEKKSWAGSISMFISGFLLSAVMMFYFSSLGYIDVIWKEAIGKLALVALAATVVECIPLNEVVDDNISVPLTTMLYLVAMADGLTSHLLGVSLPWLFRWKSIIRLPEVKPHSQMLYLMLMVYSVLHTITLAACCLLICDWMERNVELVCCVAACAILYILCLH